MGSPKVGPEREALDTVLWLLYKGKSREEALQEGRKIFNDLTEASVKGMQVSLKGPVAKQRLEKIRGRFEKGAESTGKGVESTPESKDPPSDQDPGRISETRVPTPLTIVRTQIPQEETQQRQAFPANDGEKNGTVVVQSAESPVPVVLNPKVRLWYDFARSNPMGPNGETFHGDLGQFLTECVDDFWKRRGWSIVIKRGSPIEKVI